MLLIELAETSGAVAASPARLAKIERLAACLARLAPDEVTIAVAYLSGELRQRHIGVGYAMMRDLPPPAHSPTLGIAAVDAAFADIGGQAGPGSQRERRRLLAALFGRATAVEQQFLRRLLGGELRQGALEGVMVDAVTRAAGVPASEVRRALMLRGALGPVAEAALTAGAAGLGAFRLTVGRPLQPMLAQTADTVDAALVERVRPAAFEWKLDGARVQIHRADDEVGVFTRSLEDITARLPEVVEAARALPVRSAVLDGEVIALRPDGRPHPFQVTASRVGNRLDVATLRDSLPLHSFVFDLLHLDGADLLDAPGERRTAALVDVVPPELVTPRVVADVDTAAAFFRQAVDRGHEGVVVKSLSAPYEAGRRGAGWIKVKPRHTLDLVVLAVEWGHGRRRGWLSNLHLGARDPVSGGFTMLGKTFKGLTDEMLRWQTDRLLRLEVGRDDWVVYVRPELVVEVAFDGVQTSPRYPGGVALRFARVLRHRPDKNADDADTMSAVHTLHSGR